MPTQPKKTPAALKTRTGIQAGACAFPTGQSVCCTHNADGSSNCCGRTSSSASASAWCTRTSSPYVN